MKIEHIALWCNNLEKMKNFYTTFFSGKAGAKYQNLKNGFESYFITFKKGARLEIMRRETINKRHDQDSFGYAHLAFAIETKERLHELTKKLIESGCENVSNPRLTGDGYYESCVKDPEGNLIELVLEHET